MAIAEERRAQELPGIPDIQTIISNEVETLTYVQEILNRYDSTQVGLHNADAWKVATIINPIHILSHTDNTFHADATNIFPSEDDDVQANKIVDDAKNIAAQMIADIELNPETFDAIHAVSELSYEPDLLGSLTPSDNRGALFNLEEDVIAQRQANQTAIARDLDGKIPQYVSAVETYILPMTVLYELIQPKNTTLSADGKANLIERLAVLLYVDQDSPPQRENDVRKRLHNALKDLDYSTNHMRALGQVSEHLVPFEPRPRRQDKEWDTQGEIYTWLRNSLVKELGLDPTQPIPFDEIDNDRIKQLDAIPAEYSRVLLQDKLGQQKTYDLPVFVENQFGQLLRPVSIGDFIRIYKADPKEVYETAILHGTRLFEKPRIVITEHDGKETFKPMLGLVLDFRHHGSAAMRELLDIPGDIAKNMSDLRRNIARKITRLSEQRRYDPLLQGPVYREVSLQRFPEPIVLTPERPNTQTPTVPTKPPIIYRAPIERRNPRAFVPATSQQPDPNDQGLRWDVGVRPPGSELGKAS